jgi:hypothetical protein
MLRDVNAASNNIYNVSVSNGFNGLTDLDATQADASGGGAPNMVGFGRDSRASSIMMMSQQHPGQVGPRTSMGNISNKLLDKKFNKILSLQQARDGVIRTNDQEINTNADNAKNNKKHRKRKTQNVIEHNV